MDSFDEFVLHSFSITPQLLANALPNTTVHSSTEICDFSLLIQTFYFFYFAHTNGLKARFSKLFHVDLSHLFDFTYLSSSTRILM